jgi:hypothetical protein
MVVPVSGSEALRDARCRGNAAVAATAVQEEEKKHVPTVRSTFGDEFENRGGDGGGGGVTVPAGPAVAAAAVVRPPAPVSKPAAPMTQSTWQSLASRVLEPEMVNLVTAEGRGKPKSVTLVCAVMSLGSGADDRATTLTTLEKMLRLRLPSVLFLDETLKTWPEVKEMLEIAATETRQVSYATLPEGSAQVRMELYNRQRIPWLQEAAALNYFETEAFLWIDGNARRCACCSLLLLCTCSAFVTRTARCTIAAYSPCVESAGLLPGLLAPLLDKMTRFMVLADANSPIDVKGTGFTAQQLRDYAGVGDSKTMPTVLGECGCLCHR